MSIVINRNILIFVSSVHCRFDHRQADARNILILVGRVHRIQPAGLYPYEKQSVTRSLLARIEERQINNTTNLSNRNRNLVLR